MDSKAQKLADWIVCSYAGYDLTPLKLQKLMFYCFGAACAFGVDRELAPVEFEAWPYGPVVKEVWQQFKGHGRVPISKHDGVVKAVYSDELDRVLQAALTIYGAIPVYPLVDQTHREGPWIKVWDAGRGAGGVISKGDISEHFRNKFCCGHVTPPEALLDTGSLALDGIPVVEHQNIFKLADSIKNSEKASFL